MFFLREKEYYRKRANLIEEWKACKIKLVYNKQTNFVAPDTYEKGDIHNKIPLRKYIINIQTPNDPNIPRKTAVYHELGHLLWDSFRSEAFTILREWAKDKIADLFNQKQIKSPERLNIPYHIQQEISKTQSKMEEYIASLYINCFNCLEDQRIESLTQEIWLATGAMFDEAKTNLGKDSSCWDMLSPPNHLLAARFNRPELTSPRYIDAMKDVEGKGWTGTIGIMRQIKDLIDEAIGKNLGNSLSNMKRILDDGRKTEGKIPDGCGKDLNSIPSKYEEERRKFDRNSKNPNVKALMEKFRDNIKVESLEEQIKKQKQEANQELQKATAQEKKEHNNNPLNISRKRISGKQSNKIIIEKLRKVVQLGESEKDARKEINNILEKINKYTAPKEPAHILTNYKRELKTPNPNRKLATQLAKTFDKIKETKKFKITENGSEVDIEALLQTKTKGYGEFMVDEVRSKGLTIFVTIDGSGSMDNGDRISQARNLVSTMFRSVERIPQVKILANVWSSDWDGNVGITSIRTEGECNRINTDSYSWGTKGIGSSVFTPTHEALRYSAKQLTKYSGKKLLIMITDGYPQYVKNGHEFSMQALVNLTMKEYRKAQRYCRNIMCINVSPDDISRENLKRIFKKNYVEFPGMEKASKFVLKNFRKTVTATLRR